MQNKSLRIGIMFNGLDLATWEADTIRNLLNVPGVKLELLIGDADVIDPVKPIGSKALKSINIIKKILIYIFLRSKIIYRFLYTSLWTRYQQISNRYFTASCDSRVSMNSEFMNIDMIYCKTTKKGKYSQYFKDEDVSKIKTYNLDMILRFGFNIIRGDILATPRYGVWSFHHGNYLRYRGGPPGFWEIYNEDPYSGAILQKLTDKLDDGVVLYQSNFKTDFRSYNKNKSQLFWNTTKWPAIVCRNIIEGKNNVKFEKSQKSSAPIYKAPNNYQTIKYFYIVLKKKLSSFFVKKNKMRELWAIGFTNEKLNSLINPIQQPKIHWLNPPKGRFYADPFAIQENGISYIFFEDYSYEDERGRISFFETRDFNKISNIKTAIEMPYHLSYPFIVMENDRYYCIPEQYESNEIVLYKADNFPDKWSKEKTLINNFAGVDPTILFHEGLWWMFVANQKDNDSSKLYIFYSEKLDGDWHPNISNPVKIYPQSTRPAGPIIKDNGRLIRPAQNCTKTYGGGIFFYEIIKLTKSKYKEKFIGEILPDQESDYPDGLHHIVPLDNITIVDGKRWM